MAQERHITPEKQLLKLIEAPKTKTTKALAARAIKHHSLSLLSFGALRGRISFLKDGFRKWFKGGGFRRLNIDIKVINKILGVGILILVFYFISSLSLSIINLKEMPGLKFKARKSLKSASFPETAVLKKAASYYLEKVRGRDIFRMGAQGVADTTDAEIEPPSSKIIEATQNLRLVGISWSDDPDVMVEDTKALRTFFIKRGQMIGQVKVEAIFKDKVVLTYGGEEIELR